jgi:hypothetical protein
MIIMKVVITGGTNGCSVECFPDIVDEPMKVEDFFFHNITSVVHEASKAIGHYLAQQNPENVVEIIDLDNPDSPLRDGLMLRIKGIKNDNDDAKN